MISNNDLLVDIEELLNASSTSVPIAQLSCLSRYEIFIDLLRGHVPFRGGKIRDFPMSRYRFIAGRLFEYLCDKSVKEITRKGKKIKPSFASYINVFYLVEKTGRESVLKIDDYNQNEYFNLLILNISKMLFSDSKDSVRHLTMLLGVSNSEFNQFYDKKLPGKLRDINKYTEHLLVIANHDFKSNDKIKEIMSCYGINEKQLESLRTRKVKIISIKTKDVQSYLDRCKSLFILRGASYWCSQVMSIVRDLVLEELDINSSILVDSDSIILLFSNDNTDRELLKIVKSKLIGSEGTKQIIKKHPRMESYIDDFSSDVFPNIGILEFYNISVFDLATDKGIVRTQFNSEKDKIEFESIKGEYQCTLVNNKFSSKPGFIPEWYTKVKPDNSFSFDATLFSLCEISFNQQTIIESKFQLELETRVKINYSQYGSRVPKELGLKKEISYLKYDGDDIGKKFTSISSIERPILSFSLESRIKRALIDALVHLEKTIDKKHLVHDLIYSGGDDLFLSLPTEYEAYFIKAMNISLMNQLPEFQFTCSVIRVEQSDSHKETMIHSLVSLLSNDLLTYAKSQLKKNVEDVSNQSKLYEKYGTKFLMSHSKGILLNTSEITEMEVNDLHRYYFQ